MKKTMKNVFFTILTGFLLCNISISKAQNLQAEASASANLEENLPETVSALPEVPAKKEMISAEKATVKTSNTTAPSAKQIRKAEKAEKFLKSKVGQYLVKRALIKAEKKQLRQELKKHKGDKATQKVLREKSEENIKAISGNLRLALIFGIIGVILYLIPGLWWLGTICIVIALIFLLLEVI